MGQAATALAWAQSLIYPGYDISVSQGFTDHCLRSGQDLVPAEPARRSFDA